METPSCIRSGQRIHQHRKYTANTLHLGTVYQKNRKFRAITRCGSFFKTHFVARIKLWCAFMQDGEEYKYCYFSTSCNIQALQFCTITFTIARIVSRVGRYLVVLLPPSSAGFVISLLLAVGNLHGVCSFFFCNDPTSTIRSQNLAGNFNVSWMFHLLVCQ